MSSPSLKRLVTSWRRDMKFLNHNGFNKCFSSHKKSPLFSPPTGKSILSDSSPLYTHTKKVDPPWYSLDCLWVHDTFFKPIRTRTFTVRVKPFYCSSTQKPQSILDLHRTKHYSNKVPSPKEFTIWEGKWHTKEGTDSNIHSPCIYLL